MGCRGVEPAQGETTMGAILIRCPTTNELVPVGINTDRDSFEALPNVEAKAIRCPSCGKDHPWSRKDAILDTTCRPIPSK